MPSNPPGACFCTSPPLANLRYAARLSAGPAGRPPSAAHSQLELDLLFAARRRRCGHGAKPAGQSSKIARYGQVVDFYDYARASVPHPRRHRREEVWQPLITDDLPDRIPITEVELDILEAHFADLRDELFGARR